MAHWTSRLPMCLLLVPASGAAQSRESLSFPSLSACRVSEAAAKAAAERADRLPGLSATPVSSVFLEAAAERLTVYNRLSDVRNACFTMTLAQKAAKGQLAKQPAASQAAQMSELHEMMSDKVLDAVPNGTVRRMQEQNLTTVRSQMQDLAKLLDRSLDKIGGPVPTAPVLPRAATLTGRADPAVLGAVAAAELNQDYQQAKVAEAARLERVRLEQEARRVEEARLAVEREREAQVRLAEAEQQRSESGGGFFDKFLMGMAMGAAVINKSSAPVMPGMAGPSSSAGNSQRCQQTLAQIESDRRSIGSLQSAQAGGVGVQVIQQTIAEGQAAIQTNQNWYNQNCR